MDMDKGMEIDCGNWWWAGQRRANEKNWDNCNRINKNKNIYINTTVTSTPQT